MNNAMKTPMPLRVAKEQLHDATVLLDKGYGIRTDVAVLLDKGYSIWTDVEFLLKVWGRIEDVPEYDELPF